jgi:hypothetical protein
MKSFLRLAAITLASTALVAGASTVPANAAPGDSATVTIQPKALSGFATSTTDLVPVSVVSNRSLALRATVNVNGVPVANEVSVFSNFFTYQRAWGAGSVTLTNLHESNGAPVAGGSNAAQVRYGIEYRSGFDVRKRGKKLTFKGKFRYVDNRNKNVSIRKGQLQVKRGSKWRTVKNLKFKKNGTFTYKRKDKKKRTYRIVIKTTNVYQGNIWTTRGKI